MMRQTYSFDEIILVPRYSQLPNRDGDPSACGYDMPIVMSPMDTVTTSKMIDLFIKQNLMATVHRYFHSPEDQLAYVKNNCKEDYSKAFFAIGSVKKYKEWIDYLIQNGVKNFCVDMAHGDSELCVDTVKYLRGTSWDVYSKKSGGFDHHSVDQIMAGNVVTKSGFGRLQDAGADYIRVGIGGGSICSTRLNTGFGLPQGTAVEDCASKKKTAKLISDGGIKHNGDFAKAIACGADMVMCGKMLAGTDLADGDCYNKDKNLIWGHDKEVIKYKEYHGMASAKARSDLFTNSSIEGRSGLIPYTGTTEDFLKHLKLNLQASLSYAGVRNWEDFKTDVKAVLMSSSGIIESSTHLAIYND